MSVDHQLTTALHQQIDGQTEPQSETAVQSLRACCIYEQGNWAEPLPLADFVFNNSLHTLTRMTPFWAMYYRNPATQFKAPKASNLKSENQTDATLEGLAGTHQILCQDIRETQQCQTNYASGKEMTKCGF